MNTHGAEQADSTIDLHIHSNHSDGLLSPHAIVEIAHDRRLRAISITDHDTISGVAPAVEAGAKCGLEIVPGVELSSSYKGAEVHILGYYIDIHNPILCEYVNLFTRSREERARKILIHLGKLGMHVPFELVKRKVNGGSICRPHIADVLVEEGHCFSHYEAFEKYLGEGKPAYVPKMNMSPVDAVRLIKKAGGLAFLAHPAIGGGKQILHRLREFEFDGIEIIHPKHSAWDVCYFSGIAGQNNLLCSGGSDCHGARPGEIIIGSLKVSYHLLKQIKDAVHHSHTICSLQAGRKLPAG